MADSPKLQQKIEETVVEILKNSNMDETTEYKVRKMASEKLGLDLSPPERKQLVRKVVESYLADLQSKAEAAEAAQQAEEEEPEEEDDEEEQRKRKRGGAKEYDDDGDLIICRVSLDSIHHSSFYIFLRVLELNQRKLLKFESIHLYALVYVIYTYFCVFLCSHSWI